jgi:hypothetical protein
MTTKVSPYASLVPALLAVRLPGAFLSDVLGEHCRRKGDERNGHQQEEIDEEKDPIGLACEREHNVMVHPHDPDGEKTERIREVGGPEVQQALADVVPRQLDFEHEQGRGDGKDAVGEGLEASRGHRCNRNAGVGWNP